MNYLDRTKPMNRAFNVAVLQIASQLFPTGYDVGPDAPDTLEKLNAHIASTGRMKVYDGASENTIFADPEVNYAFRAWHDFHHWKLQAPFNEEGERAVFEAQLDDIRKLYGTGERAEQFAMLLRAEVLGQLEYKRFNGDFPKDQWLFTVATVAPLESVLHAFR